MNRFVKLKDLIQLEKRENKKLWMKNKPSSDTGFYPSGLCDLRMTPPMSSLWLKDTLMPFTQKDHIIKQNAALLLDWQMDKVSSTYTNFFATVQ